MKRRREKEEFAAHEICYQRCQSLKDMLKWLGSNKIYSLNYHLHTYTHTHTQNVYGMDCYVISFFASFNLQWTGCVVWMMIVFVLKF